jgi:hypothetical protein
MNEPTSIVAEMLGLSLLAGTKEITNADGSTTCKPILDLSDVRHTPVDGTVRWPGVAAADVVLFNYAIPENQCLVVTYVSAYATASDESEQGVDYGLNFYVPSYWRTSINGSLQAVTATVGSQVLLNSPCLLVFPGGAIPQLVLQAGGSTQAAQVRRVCARMNAYQASNELLNIFRRHQSIFAL